MHVRSATMIYLQFNTLTKTGTGDHSIAVAHAVVKTADRDMAARQLEAYLDSRAVYMGEVSRAEVLGEIDDLCLRDNLRRLYREARRTGLACLLVSIQTGGEGSTEPARVNHRSCSLSRTSRVQRVA